MTPPDFVGSEDTAKVESVVLLLVEIFLSLLHPAKRMHPAIVTAIATASLFLIIVFYPLLFDLQIIDE